MLGYFKKKRRHRLRETLLTESQLAIVRRNVPYWKHLPEENRTELQGLIQVFLAEKSFEGCGGLETTEEIRLTIAGLACLLLLRRETDFFPGLQSILVYPTTFVTDWAEYDEDGLVTEEERELHGESWSQGSLVLSWEDIREDIARAGDGFNVVLHEFAHQLDDESGDSDGAPLLPDPEMYDRWSEVFGREFAKLGEDLSRRRRTLFDAYAADNPAEFFAVATETFFERPGRLLARHPDLYKLLRLYYRQDPVAWTGKG